MKRFTNYRQALALLFLLFLLQPTDAQIFVDQDATGANNGTSWKSAYTDLQSALAAATSGDQIWVAEGTYLPTTGTDRTISFDLPSGVEVYGGFEGNEGALGLRDWENNLTILSGNIGEVTLITDNSYTIVNCFQISSSTILDGFTIEDGYANGFDTPTRSGAAIFINGASMGSSSNPQIKNCTMMDNTAV